MKIIPKIFSFFHESLIGFRKLKNLSMVFLLSFLFPFLHMCWEFGLGQTIHMLHNMVAWKFLINFSIFAFLSTTLVYATWNKLAEKYISDDFGKKATISIGIIITILITSVTKLLSQISYFVWFSSGKYWCHGMDFKDIPSMIWAWKNQLLIFPHGEIKISTNGH
ncbi:hypothetical protein [Acetobacter sp. P5B1]|uniref:hypothetical protein n=1 Tax=Acetobacter sp. P5B1 TaxID=2762620 RepID=UPI001C055C72|nr:hypothetical protein [Acetobacter sp. P5B1]